MRLFLTLLLVLGLSYTSLTAQTAPDYWGRISPDAIVLPLGAERQHEPLQYTSFTLDYDQIAAYLRNAPQEFTAEAKKRSFLVTLPMADGTKETFSIVKTHIMAASLEAKRPDIGTYAGEAIHKPGMQVRLTVTPQWGLQGFITRPDKGIEYIEPVAVNQNQFYMVYDRVHYVQNADMLKGTLKTDVPKSSFEIAESLDLPRFSPGDAGPGDGEKLLGAPVKLKVYKLAVACTVEFSIDNGTNKDAVFAKVTTFVNQLNAIYERDIDIRVVLIPESYDIIFNDPNNNPYSGTSMGGWVNQNPQIMLQYLGSPDKYDIGHIFAKYIGTDGNYGLSGGLCCTQFKGRAGSASTLPYGDDFFFVVSQEIGHGWAGGHTFNRCYEGAQFNYESACEPGSGSTIMSYSGICDDGITNNNVNGDGLGKGFLYYHACSIAEIQRFNYFQEGTTCGSILETSNTAPVVTTNYPAVTFIPISTPFELTGSAEDMEGGNLTYSWDEIDLGPTTPLGSPMGSSPLFRWYEPTGNPTRTFPKIETVIANTFSKTEVLPTYNRDIRFVLVARDNTPGGGGVAWDTVELRSTSLAGPFLVSYPNTVNIKWKVGEYQTILWDVANTDKAPVNAKTVNIKLSTDNGLTYPITLATGVPNNGKHCIEVPGIIGTNMRIRVEAADNVFFDISNSKFEIAQPTAGISLCASTAKDFACLPGNYTTEISTAGLGGVADPITLTATGLPNGATASFSPNPVQPGSSSTMTISFAGNTAETTFDVTVQGSASAANATSIVTLTTVGNNFSAFAPTFPLNGASGVNQQPPLKWTDVADADFYDVELATNPSFEPGAIVASRQNVVVDSFQVNVVLEAGKVYFWRVRPQNDCGEAAWSEIQAFVVAIQSCNTFDATDLPKNISANGTPTVESKITLASGGAVSDVNIKKIQGNHAFFKDLEVHLIGPGGGDALLWKDKCAAFNGSFNLGMDDGAAGSFPCPPPNNGTSYKPTNPLTIFNGLPAQGVWTLRVKDNNVSGGGSLAAFSLEICSNVALNPPVIVINNPLAVNSGDNAAIGDNLLKADDPNTPPANLVFTLMSLPKHGLLLVNGGSAVLGTQFTQADISNGGLRYYDYGLNQGQDKFNFAVTDGDGGLATGTYVVEPFSVGTREPNTSLAFELAPNPSSSFAVLSLDQPLSSDARVTLLNAAGQVVTTWQLAAGAYALRLDLQNLPKGVYAVSLENERWKGVKKLVVQ